MSKKTTTKKPKQKKQLKLNKKNVIKICVSLFIILTLSITSIFAFNVYKETEDFDSEKLLSGEASKIYDADGNLVYTYGSDVNGTRQNVSYSDLPQVLVDAVVAAEDSRFFEHNGFDLPRIAKAFITNALTGSKQGGSTITQQVVKKSYFPNAEQTYSRKASEVVLAIQADKELSKEDIITLYLNKIYFGRSTKSIGVAAASKYYFNKDVQDLTLPEAALLAGSLNSPYNYDPYYNLDKATARRNTILNLMVDHGYITEEEATNAKAVSIENTLDETNNQTNNEGYLAAYVDLVTKEVKKKTGYDPSDTQMDIHTYLKTDIQQVAYNLNSGETYKYSDEDLQMSGSVTESLTGRIVSVLGGRNYKSGDLNLATVKQQPGSSVKPFLDYGMAIESLDWCSEHYISDEPWEANASFKPKNWDGSFHGKISISNALENSWNVAAVRTFEAVEDKVDASDISDAMESIGIDMSNESVSTAYAIGGWKTGISPIEMCSAYSTIANNGKYTESHACNYVKIVSTGEKFEIDKKCQKKAKQSYYSEATAFIIRQIQLGYTKNGSGNYRYLTSFNDIAAKTGTSNFSGSKYVADNKSKDLWMTAYNADYVCSVWMGFQTDGIKKGKNTSTYSARPGEVVQKLFNALTKDGVKNSFPDQPDTAVQATILTGVYPYKAATANTPESKKVTAWFKKGTTPTDSATDYGINDLSSFKAELNSSGTINFSFAEYDPKEAITNAEYNDATKAYGTVVYVVEVTDDSGNVLKSEHYTSNVGSIDYKPTGSVKVVGYYSYSEASSVTSNKITVSLTPTVDLTAVNGNVTAGGATVNNGATISATSINVKITKANSSDTTKIYLYDGNRQLLHELSTEETGFSGLVSGSTYQVVMTESNGSKTVTKTVTFKVQ
ncbi:MAG: transglycosylase domain-containing protein [Thomasclavelia sp.]|nr:transglycosylase domain-containing protein [Thomasclavelia sp.]